MKWVWRMAFCGLPLIVFLIALVQVVIMSGDRDVAGQPLPTTVELIATYGDDSDIDTESSEAETTPTAEPESDSNSTGASEDIDTKAFPNALERTPTRDEIVRFLSYGMRDSFGGWIELRTDMVMNGLISVLGGDDEPIMQYSIGKRLVARGDIERGEQYLRAALLNLDAKQDRYARARVFEVLAWIEPDPEKAVQLLDLSCVGRREFYALSNATLLCEVTGSEELAAHYRKRYELERERANVKLVAWWTYELEQEAGQ